MANTKYFSISLFLVLLALSIHGQTGTIRGTLYDDSTGETIPFANILVAELGTGTTTDLDGAYTFDLAPGTYTLEISFIGYTDLSVNDVVVKEDKVNLLDLNLSQESEILEEVVISSTQIRNTEAAILTLQRKSPNLLDGVSSQTFNRTGDSDAASAIKRVTGVSVEGGRHVYVRGLGDRYTKTILNGIDIPGLDPDRNTVQMDIFPTILVDNIIVYKTFSPDLPADFTGGMVDVVTQDFPDDKIMSISVGIGYNPSMHFQENFLQYEGGVTDWLALDDGTRELPIAKDMVIPDPVLQDPSLSDITNSFNKTLSVQRASNNLDKSFSIALGDQIGKTKVKLGYNAALNYKHEFTYYDDVKFNSYVKFSDPSMQELELDKTNEGQLGITSAFWSALVGGSLKVNNYRISIKALKVQNGESSAGRLLQQDYRENPATIDKSNLEYVQRSITNLFIGGKHLSKSGKTELQWKFSPTISKIEEPDIRFTGFEITPNGEYLIQPSVGATSSRTFRDLRETSYNGKIDFTLKPSEESKMEIKIGAAYIYKERDYEILNYFQRVRRSDLFEYSGDPDELLFSQNVWNTESGAGTFIRGNFEPANTFNATATVAAAYVMNELPISDKFKAIYGIRVEKAENKYTGQNNSGSVVYEDETVLDETDFLPSINTVYSVNEDMNFRVSYSRTLARPSFKEKSIAQIQDRISGRTFSGNIDLEETKIHNFDFRWEYFFGLGEILSMSAFFKDFTNPIELVAFSEASPNSFQPVNVGNAQVLGFEFETRKSLKFLGQSFSHWSAGTNVSLVHSSVKMKDSEYLSRLDNARDGEVIKDTRQLVGQSPFIINAFLGYNELATGFAANLSYNVQGRRLAIVGIGRNPDVFELPFNSLNFKASKKVGLNSRSKLSFAIENILSSEKERVVQSFGTENQIFELYVPERKFSFGFSYVIK